MFQCRRRRRRRRRSLTTDRRRRFLMLINAVFRIARASARQHETHRNKNPPRHEANIDLSPSRYEQRPKKAQRVPVRRERRNEKKKKKKFPPFFLCRFNQSIEKSPSEFFLPQKKSKNSPFHVFHQVLSLRVVRSATASGTADAGVVIVVAGVLEVGEVARVDVGRIVRRRDGKLVVLGTV